MINGLFTIISSYVLYDINFKNIYRKILNETDHFLDIVFW